MASGRNAGELEGIHALGHNTDYPTDYAPQVLEAFVNKHPGRDYFVKFNCPEFTSLCPMTGQPDFATIYISYVPDEKLVESKSLKLYLFSFRNHRDFHEDCINIILNDLVALMDPKYIEVWGKFTPRGGLSIDPYANYGKEGTEWFDVAKHPNITFKSTKVEPLDGKRLKVTGNLTVKGIAKPVVLVAKLNHMGAHPMVKKPAIGFDATTHFKRSDFGMTDLIPSVSDRIDIKITTEAIANGKVF